MPTFLRLGFKGGVRRPESPSPVASPTGNIKTPYWARTEVTPSVTTTPPVAHTIQRKPVGSGAGPGTSTNQSTSASTKSIPRKPVPTSPSPQPWKYVPVEGNPYQPGPGKEFKEYGIVPTQPEAASSASQQPVPQTITRPYSPPHWASEEEFNNFHIREVRRTCAARVDARNAQEEIERPLTPGSIFANGGTYVPERKASTAAKVFTRGIGSVRKAAGQAASQAKRALSVSHEPKISAPAPRPLLRAEGVPPLDLVGLEVAQGHTSRYGQPDHRLVDSQVVANRAFALSLLTGEPLAAQLAREAATPTPAPTRTPTIARKPPVRPPRPASPGISRVPAPPGPPAAPVSTKSKANPRMVLGNGSQETVFTDFVNAANDPSWVKEASHAQPTYQGKGKGRAAPNAVIPNNPFSSRPLAPKPLNIRKVSNAPVVDKSLPPTPPEQLPTRHNTMATSYDPKTQPVHAETLAAALEAQGVNRASYVPGIKCSDCGRMIDAWAVSDHRCGRRAAQTVDNEAQPTGRSRADVYAANFGDLSLDDKPQVVVDTFLREGHTSWKGLVRSKSGGSSESLGGKLGGGARGVRRSNEADGADAAGKDVRHKKNSGLG